MELALVNNGRKVDAKPAYSGGRAAQSEAFVHPSKDYAGSFRPVPEGVYDIGKIYRGNHGPAFGKVWIPFEVFEQFRVNNRGAFGFHDDANRETSRGSAGCIVTYSPLDLEYVIDWMEADAKPDALVVDWGTGFLKEAGYDSMVTGTLPKPVIAPSLLSQVGLKLITGFEGLHRLLPDGRVQAYPDTLPGRTVWTIGYGHTRTARQGQIISQAHAVELLKEDVRIFELAVRRNVKVPLNQAQFDALVSFNFNLGEQQFKESTLLERLNNGDYAGAAATFPWYRNAGGKPHAGLIRRRRSERHLFETGKLNFFE